MKRTLQIFQEIVEKYFLIIYSSQWIIDKRRYKYCHNNYPFKHKRLDSSQIRLCKTKDWYLSQNITIYHNVYRVTFFSENLAVSRRYERYIVQYIDQSHGPRIKLNIINFLDNKIKMRGHLNHILNLLLWGKTLRRN